MTRVAQSPGRMQKADLRTGRGCAARSVRLCGRIAQVQVLRRPPLSHAAPQPLSPPHTRRLLGVRGRPAPPGAHADGPFLSSAKPWRVRPRGSSTRARAHMGRADNMDLRIIRITGAGPFTHSGRSQSDATSIAGWPHWRRTRG